MNAALKELVASINRIDSSEGVLETIAARIPSATETEQSMVYTLEREESLSVGTALSSGLSQPLVRNVLSDGLCAKNEKVFAYNPARPEARQRNRALTFQQLTVLNGGVTFGMVRDGYPRLGVGQSDNMRVIVCDGPTLLAWVGVFREDALGRNEQRALQAIAEPLRRRLRLDLQLEGARLRAAALDVLLDLLPTEAYVVHVTPQRFRIAMANRTGQEAHDAKPTELREALRSAVLNETATSEFTVHWFAEKGLPDYALLTRRSRTGDLLGQRLSVARRRWGLTPRQTEVLALLARGAANKTIALELECAASTVELHVTALLSRAQVESRSALVAMLWSMEI